VEASAEPVRLQLPTLDKGNARQWKLAFRSNKPAPQDDSLERRCQDSRFKRPQPTTPYVYRRLGISLKIGIGNDNLETFQRTTE
jgi:hypothetical protein